MTKIIRIPEKNVGYDEIINNFLSVVDTPEFQALRDRNQLDLIYKAVFPGAKHSVYEHSVGTLHHETNLIDRIRKKRAYEFNEIESETAKIAALLHDIAKPPWSHAIEYVLMAYGEPSHDEKSIETLRRLKEKIKNIPSIDFELLLKIFKENHPLHQTIWGIIGSDVLDHVNRDADRCGVSVDSDANRIETHAYYDGKTYGALTNVTEVIIKHYDSHNFMYLEVYNRKVCSLIKGLIRRGVYEMIGVGKAVPSEIWDMTDDELKFQMISAGGIAKDTYMKIRNRVLPHTFLTVKIEGYESREEIGDKDIKIYELSEEELMKIVDYFRDINHVIEFEKELEKSLHLEPGDTVLAEMPHLDMLRPKDINLYKPGSGWTSLFKERPEYKETSNINISRFYALRLGVSPEHRREAYRKSDVAFNALCSLV